MLEHKILKALLNKECYTTNRKYLKNISRELQPWFATLDWWHTHKEGSLSLEDFYDVHVNMFNPTATNVQLEGFRQIRDLLKDTEVNPEVVQTLIQEKYRQDRMADASLKLAKLAEKGSSDVSQVLKDIEEINTVKDARAFTPLTITTEQMVETTANQGRWKFHLPILQEKIGGIGPGVFGLIAARPNGGKSLAAISSCFHPEGWAAQGARIAYIANEELVHRHKSRAVCCYTGFDSGVLSNASRLLTEIKVRERKGETVDAALKEKVYADIAKFNEASNKFDAAFKDTVMFYHEIGMPYQSVDALIDEQKPDIVIIDQLDKLYIDGDLPSHEKMRLFYTAMREYSTKHGVAIIGICQASESAEGRKFFSFDALEHSKTGKAAELDLCICIGKEALYEDNNVRYFYLAKNKLTGNESSGSFMIEKNKSRMVV